jgi:hypothetical protein
MRPNPVQQHRYHGRQLGWEAAIPKSLNPGTRARSIPSLLSFKVSAIKALSAWGIGGANWNCNDWSELGGLLVRGLTTA